MSTAPFCWNQVIDPQRCTDLEDFLNGVKYNEDALISSVSGMDPSIERRMRQMEQNYPCKPGGKSRNMMRTQELGLKRVRRASRPETLGEHMFRLHITPAMVPTPPPPGRKPDQFARKC